MLQILMGSGTISFLFKRDYHRSYIKSMGQKRSLSLYKTYYLIFPAS